MRMRTPDPNAYLPEGNHDGDEVFSCRACAGHVAELEELRPQQEIARP